MVTTDDSILSEIAKAPGVVQVCQDVEFAVTRIVQGVGRRTVVLTIQDRGPEAEGGWRYRAILPPTRGETFESVWSDSVANALNGIDWRAYDACR